MQVLHTSEDANQIYLRYLPVIIRFVSTFAMEIPAFLDLNFEDQRHLIKGCILEVAAIQDSMHVQLETGVWEDEKLKFRIEGEQWENFGLFGEIFTAFHKVAFKIRKLKLTDVEISLLCAIVLFTPGTVGEGGEGGGGGWGLLHICIHSSWILYTCLCKCKYVFMYVCMFVYMCVYVCIDV